MPVSSDLHAQIEPNGDGLLLLLGRSSTGGVTLEAALPDLLASTAVVMAASRVVLWRNDGGDDLLRYGVHETRPAETAQSCPAVLAVSAVPLPMTAAETPQVVGTDDRASDPAWAAYRAAIADETASGATLAATVHSEGRCDFLLVAETFGAPRTWSADDRLRIAGLAAVVARLGGGGGPAAEAARRVYRRHLERALAERTAALLETQSALARAESLASLGALVPGIAHEVNTPLGIGVTATSNFVDLVKDLEGKVVDNRLKRNDLTGFLDMARRSAQIIQANLERAANLVRSFKQVAADQTSEHRRTVDLGEYLGEIVTSLEPEVRKSGHRLAMEAGPGVAIESFPAAIWQVLSNLVMNSLLHAYEPGSRGTLSIVLTETPDGARITYADDGRGMPAEIAARIYDPYFTTRRGKGGTGLGMHIVQELVRHKLGGRIELQSAVGAGTRFIIDLPAEAPDAAAAYPMAPPVRG